MLYIGGYYMQLIVMQPGWCTLCTAITVASMSDWMVVERSNDILHTYSGNIEPGMELHLLIMLLSSSEGVFHVANVYPSQ